MPINVAQARQCLKDCNLECLFVEVLGWDRHTAHPAITVDDRAYTLSAVAQKRGMVAFVCEPQEGGRIPTYSTRRKIDRQVAKSAHEHLVIYVDGARTTQVWQWVKREAGKPAACREETFHHSQTGERLIQKLQALAVSIEDEESLTLIDVTSRVRAGFDVERVTKRFYDRFKTEHAAFTGFLKGIPDEGLQRWYVSVMLNRLMFIYFIQKKGFLDGDPDYLRHKLAASRDRGKNLYYRDFLCPLFFEGFAKRPQDRSAATNRLLGRVPYLNGGLFLKHQIEEQHGRTIEIPDKAFEKIFAFFDAYQWHLDERPLRRDNEINPDVLGYIFEKYINQKQMGAYYSKEDITGYIGQNTIIPFLFDAARAKCKVAFEGDHAVWLLLAADPDRYIYEPVRRGVIAADGSVIPESALPDFVQKGMHDPKARMFERRYNLGGAVIPGPDDANLALPTETWREYVDRRRRCLDLRAKLAAGEVRDVNDLITYNLDIRQFAQDVVEGAEGPDLLVAFWHAIQEITVLDPACGSGAFLFAALNILEPLYEACLQRMEAFLEEWGDAGRKRHPNYHRVFTETLARVEVHPNRKYFVLKSIIIQNLYGVDIMDEAVEICKLRLFLKLVAQVEAAEKVEPLPDIDFNIRAGNTLVGFATREAVKEAISKEQAGKLKQDKLVFGDEADALKKIEEKADDVDRLFTLFREQQTELGGTVTAADKETLRKRLRALDDELNRYLAAEYGINPAKQAEYQKWLKSHQPFHWFVEFYGIMKHGGFDAVIGNPPYVEYSKVRRDYQIVGFSTEPCGNLYAFCTERSYRILRQLGRFGFIVQAPVVSTQRMSSLRELLRSESAFLNYATFDDRPSKLFGGMHHCRMAVILSCTSTGGRLPSMGTTRYYKWYKEERTHLFASLQYMVLPTANHRDVIPKFRMPLEQQVFEKLERCPQCIGDLVSPSATPHRIFYKITGVGHWFTFTLEPPKFWRNGVKGQSTRENSVSFCSQITRDTVFCCLWSTLHYWVYQARTNCRDFNPSDLAYLPLPDSVARGLPEAREMAKKVADCLDETAEVAGADYEIGGSVQYEKFKPRLAKPIMDVIDRSLAKHYSLTDDELDFIINYDIKYRMGGGEDDGGNE